MNLPSLVEKLLRTAVIIQDDWDSLTPDQREAVASSDDTSSLLDLLVDYRLLTPYQAKRISVGKTFGLILGKYRVLDRLGAGGIGVVYRGEHLRMRSQVAIKAIMTKGEEDAVRLRRFDAEIQSIAKLRHPHIIAIFDAGTLPHPKNPSSAIHYYVMELIGGLSLEDYVRENGPLSIKSACNIVLQVASALDELHRHQLVHRDVKPSNIMISPEGQCKLLDFGIVRQFSQRFTEQGTVIGTADYIAPEQVKDASSVDIRADVYGLGGTFYWSLTGRRPFPQGESSIATLMDRINQEPPSVQCARPELPAKIDEVVKRMMALEPDNRYQDPQAVIRALRGFSIIRGPSRSAPSISITGKYLHFSKVLIVDDEDSIRSICRHTLQAEDLDCEEVSRGSEVLQELAASEYDLVLLDTGLPDMSGFDVYRHIRATPQFANVKVVLLSGREPTSDIADMILSHGDDYISKPFRVFELKARVRGTLRLKDSLSHLNRVTQELLKSNLELEGNLSARERDLVQAHRAFALALAELVERRQSESGRHLERMSRYVRCLGEEAARFPHFAKAIDLPFLHMLEYCAPLHDIGMVSLPDHVLLKPGKLSEQEHILMEAHTTLGADALRGIAQKHGSAIAFLGMAIDIVRHHHERFDGKGYPDGLAGTSIPLAARITSIADVYDALRCFRSCKPPLPHTTAVRVILEKSAGQFDPGLLIGFREVTSKFEEIYDQLGPEGRGLVTERCSFSRTSASNAGAGE